MTSTLLRTDQLYSNLYISLESGGYNTAESTKYNAEARKGSSKQITIDNEINVNKEFCLS